MIIGSKHNDDGGDDNNPVIVHDRKISCSGDSIPHDHPIVYYYIMRPGGDGAAAVVGDGNSVICEYCGTVYIYQDAMINSNTPVISYLE